jgi:cell division protease FtsH
MLSFLRNFKEIFEDTNIDEILEDKVFECNQLKNNDIFENQNENEVLKEKINKKNSAEEFIEIAKILKRKLPKYIYGQDHAIEKIVDYFKNNLIKSPGPKATFFFMGPPATGKTYLAETMAKLLKDYKVKVFDMAQYTRHDAGMTLYGSDFKFSKSKPGLLTDFVLKNPKSIIVFDEIEKAHNNIQNALLSIFNDGKMTDKNGWIKKDGKYLPFDSDKSSDDPDYPTFPEIQEVDFSETILIFTSNVGKDLYNSNYFWDLVKNDYNMAENMIIDVLSKETKDDEDSKVPAIIPPFLSRLSSGELILFKKLKFEHLIKIVSKIFKKYLKLVKANYNIEIIGLNKKVYSIFLLSFAPRIDIRRLKSKIAAQFFDLISDYIVENDLDIKIPKKVIIEISEEVNNFYENEIKPLMQEDIIKYMFRKNLTLKIEKKLEFKNNTFIYKIKNISFEKVKNIKDIGEDGIIFEVPEITFDDIAGHEKVKKRLKEIVKFLKNPKILTNLGIDIPKGMLLYGPPGTGKTMLAKALANESGLPFLSTTGTELLNIEKMDKIFETAREYAPSIIFIDEFDAIGSRDSINLISRDVFINKLLSHINGFHDDEDIFIIAATNYPEKIDPALLRSGRIDLKFEIKALDKDARKYFIEKILKSFKTEGKFSIDKLVVYTTNMNGADLEKVKREVGFEMIRRGMEVLTEDLLIEVINTVKYGEKIENIDIDKSLESTAIHEAGHAVISKILRPELKIEQITITPRKNTLGFVSYNYEEYHKNNLTKIDIKKQMQILLAGRFAQIKKYGEEGIDSGASDDLAKATNLAYIAITEYGMDEELGNINLDINLEFKVNIDDKIRERVFAWMKEAENEVKKLIDENWDKIEKVANKLLEKEILDEKEFLELLK